MLYKGSMKKIIISVFCFLVHVLGFAGDIMVLDGFYQGKNIFVHNSFGSSGVGFCVEEVRVNDNVVTDNVAFSEFEIDLRKFNLKVGDKVEVKLIYKENCKPKILNPEVLYPKSTYEIVNISVDDKFILKWSTKGETGKLKYTIEEFRWNQWLKVGEMEGVGYPALNEYTFKVTPHSGNNKFRIKQLDYTGQPKISRTVERESTIPEITFLPLKVTKEIMFYNSDTLIETMYVIYDQYGTAAKRGYSSKIEVNDLPKGVYYIYYDNVTSQFIKK